MAKQRSPDSLKAEQMYLESNGEIELVEIAKLLNISPGTIRSWKNRYKWNEKLSGEDNATLQKESNKNKRNVANEKNHSNIEDDYNTELSNNNKNDDIKTNTKRRGAPKGNKNAVGNKGGVGGPLRNKKAEKHGFFSKYLPEETLEIVNEIKEMNYLDMLWDNIMLHYAGILRAQRIMYVKDQEDMTKVLRKQKETSGVTTDSWEKEYELQFAWDKQATFLNAQSRAMSELRNMIKQYDEMIYKNWDLATEEQKLRIDKLKGEVSNLDNKDKDEPIKIIIKRKERED